MSIEQFTNLAARKSLANKTQRPFAIILACSDSRSPAELIFSQGLGDLFVIRVAGNITAPSIVGSVEFAAAKFGTQLVVVMGHTECGAIAATLDAIHDNQHSGSHNIQDIIERIRPQVQELVTRSSGVDRAELMQPATHANIRASANHLRHGSQLLEKLVSEGQLQVVTAEYSLESGKVTFLEEK